MPMPKLKVAATPMCYTPGNSPEFTQVYDTYYVPLVFFARRLLDYDEDAARDVVADVFTRFWEQTGGFESQAKIKAWLYISTRNACFNYLKSHNKKKVATQKNPLWDEAEGTVLTEITKAEVVREIYALLEILPPECRKVMRLSFMEAHSNEEIASMLKLSVSTVKNQKARGVKLIRQQLIGRGLLHLVPFLSFFWP
jgi:RNA polymerase sigma-70 factor (family 1)